MIFTLLLGFGAGVVLPQAQPVIEGLLERIGLEIAPADLPVVSFALCMMALAILLMLLGVTSSPVVMLLGAVLGVARKPVLARIQRLRD